ncbi:MAG: hypothetical protein FJ118_13020 [Deltaproteobacteria bacterium]|nr:hypothetical protein [Deltaproteobacteria bacterium]
MEADRAVWLDEFAVSCRVFKGRWSIRHCLRMYNDIKDLKIRMASRVHGKVTRYESAYNPCEKCKILAAHLKAQQANERLYKDDSEETPFDHAWAV